MMLTSTVPTSGSLRPDQSLRDRRVGWRAAGAGCRKRDVAVVGIGFEDDALPARPALQPIGAGADRIFHDAIGAVLVGVHDFARHRGEVHGREPPFEAVIRALEADAQRVAVDRLESLDLRVVVERAALARRRQHVVEADQVALEHVDPVRPNLGVEDALDAVDVVLGGQFAAFATERGVRCEINARLDPDRVRAPLVGHLRHCGGRVGHHADGPREVVVDVQRVDNRADDGRRIDVARDLRVEAGLGDRERDAQCLGHVRAMRRRCSANANGKRERGGKCQA